MWTTPSWSGVRAWSSIRATPSRPFGSGGKRGEDRRRRHGVRRARRGGVSGRRTPCQDRKSTRLNSSHSQISYAVFCLKKKKKIDKSAQVATDFPTYKLPTTASSPTDDE